jgi:hypothetical protein
LRGCPAEPSKEKRLSSSAFFTCTGSGFEQLEIPLRCILFAYRFERVRFYVVFEAERLSARSHTRQGLRRRIYVTTAGRNSIPFSPWRQNMIIVRTSVLRSALAIAAMSITTSCKEPSISAPAPPTHIHDTPTKESDPVASATDKSPRVPLPPESFAARGDFALEQAGAQSGTTHFETSQAFVMHVHGLQPGNVDGIKITFVTDRITETNQADIFETGGDRLTTGPHATFVLFLDKERKVGHVNVTYVVPGTTVGNTVAWDPKDLATKFGNFQFDGKRVTLKSASSYEHSVNDVKERTLRWNVEVNLPVVRERDYGK